MKTRPDSAAPAAEAEDVQALWDEFDTEDGTASAQAAPEPEIEDQGISEDGPESKDEAREPAEAPAPAKAESDIWANASPDLIAWRDQIMAEKAASEQRQRSEAGRLSAYQRRYEEAKAELEAARKNAEPEDDSDLTAAAKEYPDVVNPLMKRFERQAAEIDAMRREAQSRDEIAAIERQAHMDAEEARVTAAQPGWIDLTTMDDGAGGRTVAPEFAAWVRRQAPEMQAKVQRNADGIMNAAETIEVIGAFKSFMDRFNEPAPTPTPPPADTRRQRQLQASAAVASRPQVATTTGIPKDGDPTAIWAELDRQEEVRARTRR